MAHAISEDSDQTAQMHRLVWVFAVCWSHKSCRFCRALAQLLFCFGVVSCLDNEPNASKYNECLQVATSLAVSEWQLKYEGRSENILYTCTIFMGAFVFPSQLWSRPTAEVPIYKQKSKPPWSHFFSVLATNKSLVWQGLGCSKGETIIAVWRSFYCRWGSMWGWGIVM